VARALGDRVALITGAARGQGRAEAVALAEQGADIIALDLCVGISGRERIPGASPDDLVETKRLVEKTGRRIVARQADVREFDDMMAVVEEGLTAFGRIDIAVANAGVAGARTLVHEMSEDEWRTTLDINLTGVFHTVKAVLPPMIAGGRGGSIIITSSAIVRNARAGLGDYGAAKAGVAHLMKTLALEAGVHGIRVNCVSPGFVRTPMLINEATFKLFRPDLADPQFEDVEPIFQKMSQIKSRAIIEPRDIAAAVAWLASEDSSCVTGTTIEVDLGWIPTS
jgi:SDR family mycofactocin-dependent oxidoreductase